MTTTLPPQEAAPKGRDRLTPPAQPEIRPQATSPSQQRPLPAGGESPQQHSRGMPGRYALVALGNGLLMIGIPMSVPMGPAASSGGRELACLLASATGLMLLLVAGLASRSVDAWCAERRWLSRLAVGVALTLTLGTLLVFAGAGTMLLHEPPSQVYVTDIVSLTATDAQLALAGHNPYTSDGAFRDALARYPLALATPLRGPTFGTGDDHPAPHRIAAVQQRYAANPAAVPGAFDPRTLHSYPALSFLLYVPLLWAGVGNILTLHVLVFWLLAAWLIWQAPVGWRGWGALAMLAGTTTVAASLIESDEVICIALVLAAWHLRRRLWLAPVLLGLACAYKQYAWLVVPFFLLDLLLREGWRATARWAALALGAFLAPNLPYIVMSLRAWFESLWLPMSEPLFATGVGIITLSAGHILPYAPQAVYALLEVAALGGGLWLYARHRSRIGDAALMLALVPLFFAFRSLADYFAFVPWLALYAAHMAYRRQTRQSRSRLGRLTVADVRASLAAPSSACLRYGDAVGAATSAMRTLPRQVSSWIDGRRTLREDM